MSKQLVPGHIVTVRRSASGLWGGTSQLVTLVNGDDITCETFGNNQPMTWQRNELVLNRKEGQDIK